MLLRVWQTRPKLMRMRRKALLTRHSPRRTLPSRMQMQQPRLRQTQRLQPRPQPKLRLKRKRPRTQHSRGR